MRRLLWIIVVIAIIVIGFWLLSSAGRCTGFWFWLTRCTIEEPSTEGLPQLPEVSDQDTTVQIQQDLEQIDLGDINKEFETIDVDLNNL